MGECWPCWQKIEVRWRVVGQNIGTRQCFPQYQGHIGLDHQSNLWTCSVFIISSLLRPAVWCSFAKDGQYSISSIENPNWTLQCLNRLNGIWRRLLAIISHLKLNMLRYLGHCSSRFQTGAVPNTVSFLYVSAHAAQVFQPAINMLSGAKPHNVTFHLHLQLCLYLSLMCQSVRWVNTFLWQLLHTFFIRSPTPLGLLFAHWWHRPAERQERPGLTTLEQPITQT